MAEKDGGMMPLKHPQTRMKRESEGTLFLMGGSHYMNSTNSSTTLLEFIEQGDSHGLNLTIYFFAPNGLTRMPVSVRELTRNFHEYKITVQTRHELELFEILSNLTKVELVPAEGEVRVCARIHYVFKTENGQSLFDVTLWGLNSEGRSNYIMVNGIAVEENMIFYEIIKPFLPANAVNELNWRVNPETFSP